MTNVDDEAYDDKGNSFVYTNVDITLDYQVSSDVRPDSGSKNVETSVDISRAENGGRNVGKQKAKTFLGGTQTIQAMSELGGETGLAVGINIDKNTSIDTVGVGIQSLAPAKSTNVFAKNGENAGFVHHNGLIYNGRESVQAFAGVDETDTTNLSRKPVHGFDGFQPLAKENNMVVGTMSPFRKMAIDTKAQDNTIVLAREESDIHNGLETDNAGYQTIQAFAETNQEHSFGKNTKDEIKPSIKNGHSRLDESLNYGLEYISVVGNLGQDSSRMMVGEHVSKTGPEMDVNHGTADALEDTNLNSMGHNSEPASRSHKEYVDKTNQARLPTNTVNDYRHDNRMYQKTVNGKDSYELSKNIHGENVEVTHRHVHR